jgi:hypothetical protein
LLKAFDRSATLLEGSGSAVACGCGRILEGTNKSGRISTGEAVSVFVPGRVLIEDNAWIGAGGGVIAFVEAWAPTGFD